MTKRARRCVSIQICSVLALCGGLLGCGNDVVVLGDENPSMGSPDASSSMGGSIDDEGVGDCNEYYAELRQEFEQWKSVGNDVPGLEGKTYRGHLDAGPFLEVRISEQGEIRAVFGLEELLKTPPEVGKSYICETASIYDHCDGPFEAVEYKVRGASFVGRRLQLPIAVRSPWEQWCEIQIPQSTAQECSYNLLGERSSGFTGTDGCEHNGEPIDCSWYNFAEQTPCTCTSGECFLNVNFEPILMDLTFTPDGSELNGSVNWLGQPAARVWLELVD